MLGSHCRAHCGLAAPQHLHAEPRFLNCAAFCAAKLVVIFATDPRNCAMPLKSMFLLSCSVIHPMLFSSSLVRLAPSCFRHTVCASQHRLQGGGEADIEKFDIARQRFSCCSGVNLMRPWGSSSSPGSSAGSVPPPSITYEG